MNTRSLTAACLATIVTLGACGGSDPAADPTHSTPASAPVSAPAPTTESAPAPTAHSAPVSTPETPPESDAWSQDLDALDAQIRDHHPAPFVNTTETKWSERIAELKQTLPAMSKADAAVAITELVAMLDTHSAVFPYEIGLHFYSVALFQFADGIYVLNAPDRSLVGARLISIASTPIEQVVTAIAPLVSADNESALRDGLPLALTVPEYLQAKGILLDEASPHFEFTKTDGSTVTVDPSIITVDDIESILLNGEFMFDPGSPFTVPEAVTRREEQIYTDLDTEHRAFIIHYNYSDSGVDTTEADAAMEAALDAGQVDRVVLDLRYARGGNYASSQAIRDLLKSDARINRAGGLYVIVGRESNSATTGVVSWLDNNTQATLVGEPTPARPNPLVDETVFELPNSKIPVHFPTSQIHITTDDDARTSVAPDIDIQWTAAEFFAGTDFALEAALNETATP